MKNSKLKQAVLGFLMVVVCLALLAYALLTSPPKESDVPNTREERFAVALAEQGLPEMFALETWEKEEKPPLESWTSRSALVTLEGEVGIILYSEESGDRPVIMMLERWRAPEEWRGKCVAVRRVFNVLAIFGAAEIAGHVVYVCDELSEFDDFAALVEKNPNCWIWEDGEYREVPYEDVQLRMFGGRRDTPAVI